MIYGSSTAMTKTIIVLLVLHVTLTYCTKDARPKPQEVDPILQCETDFECYQECIRQADHPGDCH